MFEHNSDIDFCVLLPKLDESEVIRTIAKQLKRQGVHHTLSLLKARVPILKLLSTGKQFHYKFDLCVNRALVSIFFFILFLLFFILYIFIFIFIIFFIFFIFYLFLMKIRL